MSSRLAIAFGVGMLVGRHLHWPIEWIFPSLYVAGWLFVDWRNDQLAWPRTLKTLCIAVGMGVASLLIRVN